MTIKLAIFTVVMLMLIFLSSLIGDTNKIKTMVSLLCQHHHLAISLQVPVGALASALALSSEGSDIKSSGDGQDYEHFGEIAFINRRLIKGNRAYLKTKIKISTR